MKHILLIEDNNEIRENTAEILELAGYTVASAENGRKGIELALAKKPDIIVCDVMMPLLDGYGVLHLVQKNKDLAGTPFIFLTAKAERGDFRRGMEMGADDYITKPFSDIELLNAVESRLQKIALIKKEYEAGAAGITQLLSEFGGINALEKLTKEGNINHYKKKHVVYTEGNNPVRLFYIEKGKVKTYKTNEDGKELTVGLFTEGDFLGYTALLEETVYKDTAEAIEDAEITVIPKEDFEKLMHFNADVQRKFIQLLAQNVSEKEDQLLAIAYNSLRKRVADALITLLTKYKKENEAVFSIHISREDLANIAGTATESLIRTLSDFKSEKLVDIKGSNITILNEKKLASLLN
jgi:CRP/FNR family cyclic AMP-dependent transcriptional regulator